MKKLITYGLVLTLSALLVFPPLVVMAFSEANPATLRPGSTKSTRIPAPRRPMTPRRSAVQRLAGQTSTLLPDGRLLVVGGQDNEGPTATVAIAESQTGELVPLPFVLRQARAWHSATMLPDGRVLVAGGEGLNNKVVESAEILDPLAQTVEVISLPAFARAHHTATLLTDGRVLIVGGRSASARALNRAELWNFKTKSATTLGRLGFGRQQQQATLQSDGNILIEGGVDGNGNRVATSEIFNSESLSFEPATSAASAETNTHVAGSFPGNDATNVPTDTVIGLRFSRTVTVQTINPATLTLNGPRGSVATRIVPAESGRLAFVTPLLPLEPGTTYTVSFAGASEQTGIVVPSLFSFTTAGGESGNRYGDEDWVPDANNLRGDWRSKPVNSEAQSLPPLQAEPGVTALAGQVLTLNGRPLAGVSLQIGASTTQTDQTGRFLLTNVATGHQVMRLNGRTANVTGKTYGTFKIGVDITEGKTNLLGYTIWMPKLDTAHAVRLPSPTTKETVITNPHIPGLELRLPAQTVVRDMDGNNVTELSITPIPTNQPPFPLPAGVHVPVFFTIQPGGSQVIPPRARLIYPNFTGQPAGARIDFWNYDAEDKGWYVYGQGTVSANGRQIIPDPGVVLYEFTGAMISNPSNAPPEGPEDCNECQDGDPVDLGTGLFVYNQVDLVIPDVTPLAVSRTYRPRDTVIRPFGMGMTHPYEIFLVGDFDFYSFIDLILPDGGRIRYDRLFPGTNFDTEFEHTSSPGAFHKSKLVWNGGGWFLTLKNGTRYTFPDSDGMIGPRFAALTGIRDRNGNQIALTRDSNRNLTKITSPNGRWIEFTYDASNRITQARDCIGRTVGYTYDSNSRLESVTDVRGGLTQYTYDSSNRMTKVTDARNIIYITNVYDNNGRVTKQTQADGTFYLFAYTLTNGRVSQVNVTDPRGNVRRVIFNTSGYMISDTYPLGKPEQQTITYELAPGSNQMLSVTDALNRRRQFTYDPMGNVTSVTDLAGTSEAVTTNYTHDPVFNLLETITDPLNHQVTFTRDAKGNITGVKDALNHETIITYNAAGQVASVKDPLLNLTTFNYEAGYLTSVTDPEGRTVSRFIDDGGRVLAVTNALGQIIRYTYNAANQITKITDPISGTTQFSYDPNGNLLTVTDAKNNLTTFTYNNMDRLASRKDALLRTQTYTYDGNGNMTKFTDRRGKVTSYTYDNLNRLTFTGFGTVVSGQNTTYESTVNYTYDAGDRLTRTVDSITGTIDLGYDNLNRLTSQSSPQGSVTYSYDAANRRTGMTVTGQPAVTYSYDNADRLTSITQGTNTVGFDFDDANRPTRLTLPNGLFVDYGYNLASQVTSITYKQGAATIGDLTYGYDDAGRRTQLGGSFARMALPLSLASSTYNANNQLTQRPGSTLTYDNNGNLTSDGVNTYTWDARNQLSSMTGPGVSASFAYDPFGRRTRKTVNGAATEFLYDGGDAVQEKVGGAPTANSLSGGLDQVFTRTDASGAHHYLSDALGSTLALTDSSGNQSTQYTYEPFGSTTNSGGSSNTSQYGGRENDGTGLYYNRARYYNPKLQRFISEDPIGFAAGDTNLYAYVGNAPFNFSDPLGLDRNNSWLDKLQSALDIAGFVPGLGDVLDLVNGVISLARGDYVGAGLSAAAMIPVIGTPANAAKVARRATRFHHVFPQALRQKFKDRGIDNIDDFTLEIAEDLHRCIHSGKGMGRGGKWNKAWKDFFDKYPDATPEQIYKHAGELIYEMGLDGTPVVPYPRR